MANPVLTEVDMLRIVHPAPVGQPTRPPRGRRSAALSLTAEEVRHLRAAARNAVRAYGSASALAAVVGVPVHTIHTVIAAKGRRPSGTLAIRIAKAAGMSLEAIIGPALNEAGRCSACGSRVGDRAERRAS
jgi:hypothetical protein